MQLRTIQYLTDPALAPQYWPGIWAGLMLGVVCGLLSPLVVLKRLAFIGQGVSHAAFGGVGLVAVLGLAGEAAAVRTPGQALAQFAVVLAFCLAAAVMIGMLSRRRDVEPDTAIGVVLVVSMAVGAVLIRLSRSRVDWGSFLFGDILSVDRADVAIGLGASLLIVLTLWLVRRPLVFWAFDEAAAVAWGVRVRPMRLVLMAVLALATVTAMKLAGVVLATALLVLPGAAALALSRRSGPVVLLALAGAIVGVLGGFVLSFEANWPTGPSIVCVLAVLLALARGVRSMRGARRARGVDRGR